MKVINNKKGAKVDFKELKVGDCFLDDDGDLMMKLDNGHRAVALSDGCTYGDLCGDMVTPVNAEVHIID